MPGCSEATPSAGAWRQRTAAGRAILRCAPARCGGCFHPVDDREPPGRPEPGAAARYRRFRGLDRLGERSAPAANPVLIAAFSGWNDAASAASTALGAVAESLETELVARSTPRSSSTSRPTGRRSSSPRAVRGVAWPENLIVAGRSAGAERDLLLISGTEPSTRWRTFCNAVLDVAERCGVETMVTFGALIADVAHTRPVPVTGLATSDELIERLGFEDVAYEGPTGVLGVLHGIAATAASPRPASGRPSPTTPPRSRTRRPRWR